MAMRGRSTPTVLSEIWIDEGSCGQSQLESFLEDRDKVRLESNSLRHTKRWELRMFQRFLWQSVVTVVVPCVCAFVCVCMCVCS